MIYISAATSSLRGGVKVKMLKTFQAIKTRGAAARNVRSLSTSTKGDYTIGKHIGIRHREL